MATLCYFDSGCDIEVSYSGYKTTNKYSLYIDNSAKNGKYTPPEYFDDHKDIFLKVVELETEGYKVPIDIKVELLKRINTKK